MQIDVSFLVNDGGDFVFPYISGRMGIHTGLCVFDTAQNNVIDTLGVFQGAYWGFWLKVDYFELGRWVAVFAYNTDFGRFHKSYSHKMAK